MAGAKVCVCDNDSTAVLELEDEHAELQACVTDVSQPDQVEDLFNEVTSRLGGLDILVNNAGIGGPVGRLETVLESEWVNTIEVATGMIRVPRAHGIRTLKIMWR